MACRSCVTRLTRGGGWVSECPRYTGLVARRACAGAMPSRCPVAYGALGSPHRVLEDPLLPTWVARQTVELGVFRRGLVARGALRRRGMREGPADAGLVARRARDPFRRAALAMPGAMALGTRRRLHVVAARAADALVNGDFGRSLDGRRCADDCRRRRLRTRWPSCGNRSARRASGERRDLRRPASEVRLPPPLQQLRTQELGSSG